MFVKTISIKTSVNKALKTNLFHFGLFLVTQVYIKKLTLMKPEALQLSLHCIV